MAQFSDAVEGFGSLAVLIPICLWGIASGGLGLDSVRALQLSLAVSAVAVWFLGRRLNARGVLGWATGSRAKHRILRMPMQWFALVLLAILFITFAAPAVGGA